MIKTDAEALDMLDALMRYIAHDPTELRTPPNIQFSRPNGIVYRNKSLGWYNGDWGVVPTREPVCSQCLLTPTERNDLTQGDLAFMTIDDQPDFTKLCDYYIILSSIQAICWRNGEVNLVPIKFDHFFRVEIG